MPVCVCSVWIAQSIPVVQLPLLLKWGLHVRGGGSRQGPWGDGGWKARESRGWGWVHSCHTELLCQMMAACEGVPLIRLAGRLRLGWGQACMWVRMHRGEGICVSISVAFLSVHTGTVLTCKSISTRESVRKVSFPSGRRQLFAVTATENLLLTPLFFLFFKFASLALPWCPISLQWTRSLFPYSRPHPFHPPIPHYPVLTKPA